MPCIVIFFSASKLQNVALLSAILPFSTNVVVKYQLMVAAKMIKKRILRKGKHTKYSAKKMCHRLSLSQFLILSFSTLTFSIIHWYHTKYVYQHLTHRLYFNIIVSISIESMSSLRKMLLVKPDMSIKMWITQIRIAR